MGLLDFFKKGKEQPIEPRPAAKPAQDVQRPGASQPGATSQRDYIIQSGDSLSKIAQRYYGNASEWQKIYNANRDKIKDPDKIFPGQKIVIP